MAAATKSSVSPSDVWRDRTYPTRLIPDLPHQIHLTNHVTLLLDYGRRADIQALRDLVSAAAQHGDNVGVDEFTSEEIMETLLNTSEMFVLKDPRTTDVRAIILISHPYCIRTLDPCLAEIRIFRSRDLAKDDAIYETMVETGERLVLQLDIGYTQCMICIAESCPGLMRQLRRRNFFVVATIPDSVEMVKGGLRNNFIMVKQLGLPDRKLKSETEVKSMVESMIRRHLTLSDGSARRLEFPQVPFLPQDYSFGREMRVTFRNMEVHEHRLFYRMFKEMLQTGSGYSQYEFPTYDFFRTFLIAKFFCVFVEDKLTKQIISWAYIGDSCYTRRSPQTRSSAEYGFGVTEEFQDLALGAAISTAVNGLCLQLGYEVMLNDYFASNRKMATITRKVGAFITGVIPKGGYLKGSGWEDQVIVCILFRQMVKPFLILAEESLGTCQKKVPIANKSKI